ncbi:MAG: O-antigen ligase family protein [Pseudomonadota bacterium]
MTLGPRTYAPLFTAIFVLWPIIAYMGAQGYSAAIGLSALLGLAYLRLRSIQPYAIALLIFSVWVVAAGFWSPEHNDLLTGDLLAGSFSLDMPGIRFALTAIAGMGVVLAIFAIPEGTSRISLGVIVAVALVQFIGVLITALFESQILAALSPFSDPVYEMPQNLLRNATAFTLLLPFLLAWIWHRPGREYAPVWAVSLAILTFAAALQIGSQTSMVGMALMLICMLLVKLFPRQGFRALLVTLAGYIVTAPLFIGWGIGLIRHFALPLPESFLSRTYSWQLVRSKVSEAPIFGHGLEACHTWRDTYSDHPDWLADIAVRYNAADAWQYYPIVPVHPHNMPLQVWAETGLIGAILAAAFFLFLGWRLPPSDQWPPISRYAAAGLVGVCFAVCNFAYSMWNEAFWASAILAAGLIALQARHDGEASA